jgi:ABC-type nitrate/sulfonate/bicarbonate transport system substrate-binding protein
MKTASWLLFGAVFLLAAACGDDDPTPAGSPTAGSPTAAAVTSVRVVLDWTPNTNHTGLYVAREQGWYREEGLDVEIIQPGTTDAIQVVAAGQADFGVSVQEAIIPAREQGIPVVSIAAVLQHNTSSLMSLAEDGITRPRDLAGKTYGGFGGPLETALIETLVRCDGGNPSTVRFVEVGNVDYLVGMDQDRFDVAWIFDGWDGLRATAIEGKQVNNIRLLEQFDCIPDWYTPLLFTSEAMIADRADVVRRFMAATARGYRFAIEQPAQAAEVLLQAAPELDSALVKASAEYLAARYVDEGRPWGLQDETVWQRFEAFLRDAGLTEQPVDVKQAYTNEFLRGQ